MTVTVAGLPVRYMPDVGRGAHVWITANPPGLTNQASGLSVVFA